MKEQYLLREELQHRDKVHRGHLNHMRETKWISRERDNPTLKLREEI